jgi:hypothetical protein
MKRIIGLFLLSIALIFAYCEDKGENPVERDDPGYYYPRGEDYGWRYIDLAHHCTSVHDSFDVKITGLNTRGDRTGYDRLWAGSDDTVFVYVKSDTLFEKNVEHGVPLYKVLVGPVKTGTFWKDDYFEYLILGLESVTLTMNGKTYKNAAKIMKTNRNPGLPNTVYEWWVPEFGEVREIEVDTNDVCVRATELRYFTAHWVDP